MFSTLICQHCGRRCRCNPRVKNQEYCSRKECQQARKREWEKKKYRTNKKYREARLKSQKTWRKNYPHKEYQKEYRSRCPDYVACCYAKQKESYHERIRPTNYTIGRDFRSTSVDPGFGEGDQPVCWLDNPG